MVEAVTPVMLLSVTFFFISLTITPSQSALCPIYAPQVTGKRQNTPFMHRPVVLKKKNGFWLFGEIMQKYVTLKTEMCVVVVVLCVCVHVLYC